MGYRLGTSDELAERRKARLAARYGTPAPAVEWVESSETIRSAGGSSVAWIDAEEAKPADPLPPALPDTHRMPEPDAWSVVVAAEAGDYKAEHAPKKKGGRPKGSKNKAT